MIVVENFETAAPFERIDPVDCGVPVVFNSPHSGRHYPKAFLEASRLDERQIRRSEDTFVDELFASSISHGATFIRAFFPRAFLDVNREPYELDPSMFAGTLPAYANVRSLRVAGGLGTIARIVSDSEEIYSGTLDVGEAIERIETLYKPYHAALRSALGDVRGRFGFAVLIDCHSMPSLGRTALGRNRPDFILGDRYGSSCAEAIVNLAAATLKSMGYSVGRNKPYAGGFITEHYGRPAECLHALQIEINRGLYMDEAGYTRSSGFQRLVEDLDILVERLCAAVPDVIDPPGMAAE